MTQAPKLTEEKLMSLISKTHFFYLDTLTICVLVLTNGSSVIGESNVIEPGNYDLVIGEQMARKNAIDKLWSLEGYAVKTRGWLPSQL